MSDRGVGRFFVGFAGKRTADPVRARRVLCKPLAVRDLPRRVGRVDPERTVHALFEVAMGREALPPDRQALSTLIKKYTMEPGQ